MMHKLGLNITILAIAAIAAVVAIEICAINAGLDGIALSTSIGLIVGIPTFAITRLIDRKDKDNG